MKKIKAVVLKDATKLTNSQMKEIRGGVTVEGRPTKCSMQCDSGAIEPEIEFDCKDNWIDYELIDCSDGERLERWGDIVLVRPDPQVIWKTPKENPLWYNPHAIYNRSNTGGGSWRVCKKMPDVWQIALDELKFNIKTMGFKHTGLFPEQAVNWDWLSGLISNCPYPVKVLNLFAYTGGATIAAAAAGASVCHVDAAKGMVAQAKENAAL